MEKVLGVGNKLLKQRKFAEAISEYNKTIETLNNKKKHNANFFPSSIDSTPTDSEVLSAAYNNRGQCNYLLVNFPEAIEDYTSSLSYQSTNHTAYFNRGLVKYRLNNFEDARKDLHQALKLSPDFTEAEECLQYLENAAGKKVSS